MTKYFYFNKSILTNIKATPNILIQVKLSTKKIKARIAATKG